MEDHPKWVPTEFLELIEDAFSTHCDQLRFHETLLGAVPPPFDATTWTICTNRVYKALVKAKLLPAEAFEI